MFRKALALLLFSLLGTAASLAQPIFVWHEFHATEGGGFFEKTLKEMGTSEFQTLITLGCAAYGVDCSQQAGAIRAGAEILSDDYTSRGENYFISGRLLSHEGEEWYGVFDTFKDYEVCSAKLDTGSLSITGQSTFNASIDRHSGYGSAGLTFYAVVPKNRSSGRNWVNARFLVEYVPVGTANQHLCIADGTPAWTCKGKVCPILSGLN